MKNIAKSLFGLVLIASIFTGCKKEDVVTPTPPPPPPPPTADTITILKNATDITMGVAISYTQMLNDPKYSETVRRDFDGVTFDYHMKHGAIVQSDGSLNYTNADALVNASNGLQIFGHTLGWHSNQNASYLKTFAGINSASGPELISNGGFENALTGWSVFNINGATITAGSGSGEVRTGNGSMKVVNPNSFPNEHWRVQVSSSAFTTTIGKQYVISYWVKAATAGGAIRLSSGPTNAMYQGDQTIGTAWQQITWTITANNASTTFLFDMGRNANTYFIDDVSVKEVSNSSTSPQVVAKVDQALENFITNTVNRYKSKVRAWDVVNELFAENGALRNNTNTSTTPADVFVWSEYMGRDFALKAFNYAKAADPTALLFINDYNLESSTAKLDSLIAMVAELKGKGAKIDGIGTQMHVLWNSNTTSIDNMMKKLAATGLLIRISELDVRMNFAGTAGYVFDANEAAKQAVMYKYIVKSYMTHIPKAQQHGITIWGVTDNTSWLYNNGRDFPLMYNSDYSKKAAYNAVLDALKGK